MLMMWEQDFVSRDPKEMESATSKFDIDNYKDTKKNLKPLYKLLLKIKLNQEIMDSLY